MIRSNRVLYWSLGVLAVVVLGLTLSYIDYTSRAQALPSWAGAQ